MKMVKSLLLGSATALVALTGAQAADLPVKAKPVQYVKICSLYGAGFYYIPGTDTCLKIGGFVRAEVDINAGGSFSSLKGVNFDDRNRDIETTRARGAVTLDARSQTEFGTLRSYALLSQQVTNAPGGSSAAAVTSSSGGVALGSTNFTNAAFIQLAGFTAGFTDSFFDFFLTPAYSNATSIWGSDISGAGTPLFAYTAQFGNGLSATISAEDTTARRTAIIPTGAGTTNTPNGPVVASTGYAGREWPDLVGNLRVDQAWGSAQVMGAIHQVRAGSFPAFADHPDDEVGWAVGGGIKFNLPMLGKGDSFAAQVTYGEGALNYVGNGLGVNSSGLGAANFKVQTGNGAGLESALGVVSDAVVTGAGAGQHLDLTKGWSVVAGYTHNWAPNWKTSLYGTYGQVNYSDTASLVAGTAAVLGGGLTATGSADWSMWQVSSRTIWNPVQNLDLSLEVMYSQVNSGFDTTSTGIVDDKGWWSGIFRVQRNFYP